VAASTSSSAGKDKAYAVTWKGITTLVLAPTRGKATADVYYKLLDVYDKRDVRFQDIRAIRSPGNDPPYIKPPSAESLPQSHPVG